MSEVDNNLNEFNAAYVRYHSFPKDVWKSYDLKTIRNWVLNNAIMYTNKYKRVCTRTNDSVIYYNNGTISYTVHWNGNVKSEYYEYNSVIFK